MLSLNKNETLVVNIQYCVLKNKNKHTYLENERWFLVLLF